MADIREQKLSQLIRLWIEELDAVSFTKHDIDRDLDIDTPERRNIRRVVLHEYKKIGKIEKDGPREGCYRKVADEAPILQWQAADTENTVDVYWPFGLEEWVKIYPKSLIVIAGAPNAGKTAFCLNFVAMNMHRSELGDLLPVEYFTSEMGPEEMKVRLLKFPQTSWDFVARERSSNFVDVIRPNRINVVDYLEVTDNFFLIAEELNRIFEKLDRGICLVALQKKKGAEMGRGAEFGLEKPRLYLSLDSNKLKIIKGKNWATTVNPSTKAWQFSLANGCAFKITGEVEW